MTAPTTDEELVTYLQREHIRHGLRIKRLEAALVRLTTEEWPLTDDCEDFIDWVREVAREAVYD